jgi:hypothetical protein
MKSYDTTRGVFFIYMSVTYRIFHHSFVNSRHSTMSLLTPLFDHYCTKLQVYLRGLPDEKDLFDYLIVRVLHSIEHSSVLVLISMGYPVVDIVAATSATMEDIEHYQHWYSRLEVGLRNAGIDHMNFIDDLVLANLWPYIDTLRLRGIWNSEHYMAVECKGSSMEGVWANYSSTTKK